jgi:hypothetical protein
MKLADQNIKKILVPRTGIEDCSEPGLRFQKNDRDHGIPVFGIPGLQFILFRHPGSQKRALIQTKTK